MRDPDPHRPEPRGDEAIAPLSAMPLLGQETGINQDATVLRDRRAPHLEMSRNRVDGVIGLDEEIEHPAPHGMANCLKDIRLAIGSHHDALNISKEDLARQVLSGQCPLERARSSGRDRGVKRHFDWAFIRAE